MSIMHENMQQSQSMFIPDLIMISSALVALMVLRDFGTQGSIQEEHAADVSDVLLFMFGRCCKRSNNAVMYTEAQMCITCF